MCAVEDTEGRSPLLKLQAVTAYLGSLNAASISVPCEVFSLIGDELFELHSSLVTL